MPALRLRTDSEALATHFDAIRTRLEVPTEFAPAALELATARAAAGLAGSDTPRDYVERRDVEFLSIDPEGSRDLDQALRIERNGSGFRFFYAIADVAAWVEPGDAIDSEARRRGTTVYCPDMRIPLHPLDLSEGAASLLADEDRPALLWEISLDQRGEISDIAVARSLVRNRRAMSYTAVQQQLDAGTTDESLRLIEEVGRLRRDLETARGGVSLILPEQQVEHVDDHFELRYEPTLAVEDHNAQLSLCCGIAAASLMIGAGFGLLRTLPPADAESLDQLRRHALALGVAWPDGMSYATWVRTLDATTPQGAALMHQCAQTLRGAGYAAFDGDLPAEHRHEAIAADYAHVTAPLRRLADRFANECVLAAAAHGRPPAWVIEALPLLAPIMAETGRRANAVDHASVDVMEAAVLSGRVGDVFEAVVTSTRHGVATVQLLDPAVIAAVHDATLTAGTDVRVRLVNADFDGPTVTFATQR